MPLREKVLRGGIYLSLRQGVGLAVGVAGVLLVTRLIGPTQYGLYRGALEIMAFFAGVARWGLDAYLIRREEPPTRAVYNQAFSLLLLGSLGFAALGFLSIPLLGRWLGDIRYLAPLQVLLAALPFTVLSIPAVAQMERELDYRKVAALETIGQILYQGLSVLLAWRGWGLWAPVAGYVVWNVWTTIASWILVRSSPGWHWSTSLVREMLTYGAGYSASFWVYNIRSLVNPLIVGRYLGPEQVGFVSLTIRLVEVLGFIRAATFRLSLATLGRVQQDADRLRRALEEALGLQALALGMPLAAFALVAPVVLPRLFGDQWAPALEIYPFISLGFMVGGIFGMLASVLYVKRHNLQVTGANAAHSLLFVFLAILLVPRVGLLGYGYAEIGAMASYFVLHRFATRQFSFTYRNAIPWVLAFVPMLFAPMLDWPWRMALILPLASVCATPMAREKLGEVWILIRRGTA